MHTPLRSTIRRGSAILVTILITGCLSIIIFSILELGLFERRMNHHDRLMAQARYAAESVVENACAQIVRQLKLNSWLANDYFNTSASKFTYSPPPAATYVGTKVVPSSVELKVPNMTTVQILTVPPESPDSLRGQSIEIRRLTLYSKATARDDSGREATAYCTETLQIRGQSPATNMAFYNMELELAPGPNMTATGPFFSNRNIYFAASNSLNIQGTVTTPRDLIWGRIVEDNLNAWTTSSAAQKGTVKLSSGYTPVPGNPDAEGTYEMADFYKSGTYSDSLKSSSGAWDDTKWKNAESSTYKGNVQTRVDGTTERKLPGITDLTDPHVVIESPIKDGDTAAGYDKNVELQKFSNKAGIIIRPATFATTSSARKTVLTYTKRTKVGNKWYEVGDVVSNTTTGSTSGQTKAASIWAYVPDGTQSSYTTYEGPFTREKDDGSLGTYYLADITGKVPSFSKILTTSTGSSTSATDNSSTTYNEDLNNGFYDHREGAWMTMYNIDVAELKAAVADTANPTLNSYWNGILYVDCDGYDTTTTTPPTTSDPVVTTNTSTVTTTTTTQTTGKSGVQLVNGGLGNLPSIPGKAATEDGFTLATNDPLYIRGNFNANGNIDTGTPSNNRVADETNELMACLAADAITVLSNSWTNAKSSLAKGSKTASQTEVSAVFMTGLVSTHTGSSYSGGMHNLPRFLEYWGDNRAFGYRGSLLAFYYSKRATGLWKNDWYQPPWRIWGWDKRLENGRKVYGLGRVITFRRTGFSEISGSAYTTNTSGL